MKELLLNKSPIPSAQNKQRGRQFDLPALEHWFSTFLSSVLKKFGATPEFQAITQI